MTAGTVRLSNPASSSVAPINSRPLLLGMRYTCSVRITCFRYSRRGMATASICPFTGRTGNVGGPNCPDHAPAQFTIVLAAYFVLVVDTPTARPPETSIEVTSDPDETSTPRWRHALRTAVVSARGSTLASGSKVAMDGGATRSGSF